jgi:heat shock protein HtpX
VPPLSLLKLLAAVAAVTGLLTGLDDLLVALGASGVLRDMVSTAILALALALWPAWFTRVLPLLIARKKLLDDPVAQQRVARLLRDVLEGAEGQGQGIKQPRVLIFHDAKPVGLAAGVPVRSLILLSSGLLEQLDDREVRGTIAHELGHVTGRHMMLTAGFLATLYFGKTLFGALGLPLTLLLLLVYLAIVRRNEFDADRRGALMVGADVMKQTLARFKAIHGESAWMDRPWLTLLSTHPGFGRRIMALDGDLHRPRLRGDSQS